MHPVQNRRLISGQPTPPPQPHELPTGPQHSAKRPARRVGEKSRRGFAAMSPEQQRRIASEGGRASHESGRGHRFSADEARAAGRKGGQISRRGKKKPPTD